MHTANKCPIAIASPIARGGDPLTSLSLSAAAEYTVKIKT